MTLSFEDFDFVRRLIHEEAGLIVDADKDYLVRNRLARLAPSAVDVGRLLQRAREGDRSTREAIAEALTIQETYFFRDPWLYESLRQEALPALLKARSRERRLRIWCAACATGQEPYSVRMLMAEHFPLLAEWDVEILATDFSEAALEQARSGSYSQMEVNRGLPAPLLLKYFVREGLRWQVRPVLRQGIRFARLNLVEAWPVMERFDLILMRNVLIYFDDATRREVLQRVDHHLRGDGRLYMGGSESPLGLAPGLAAGDDGRGCYYQHQNTRIAS